MNKMKELHDRIEAEIIRYYGFGGWEYNNDDVYKLWQEFDFQLAVNQYNCLVDQYEGLERIHKYQMFSHIDCILNDNKDSLHLEQLVKEGYCIVSEV